MKLKTVGIRTRVRVTKVCFAFSRGFAVEIREMELTTILLLTYCCSLLETALVFTAQYTFMIKMLIILCKIILY